MTEQVYYDQELDQILLVDYQRHCSFGCWFYPEHGLIWLGDL